MGVDHRVGEAGAQREIGLADALLDQPARPDLAADLLVIGEMQLDSAGELHPGVRGCPQRQHREGVGGEVGLRHRHAAAVHPAVDDFRTIGVLGPAFAGRNHVAMGVQRHDRAVAEAHADDEVGAGDHAVGAHQLVRNRMPFDREPQALEQSCGRLRMGSTVARRIVGRHPDQPGEEMRLGIAVPGQEVADDSGGVGHGRSVLRVAEVLPRRGCGHG